MIQNIRINDVTIRTPDDCAFQSYNLTKAGRTAAGKMKLDFIAKKRKLVISYETIFSREKLVIMGLIDDNAIGNTMFFTVTYIEDNIEKTATMYVGDISGGVIRTGEAGWYWKDFKFDLIEQ